LSEPPDIALVSLGTTPGLVRSDESFAALVRAAGASCVTVPVRIGAAGRLRRHIAVTDLVEAAAARRSFTGVRARAVVFSTVTAALLQRSLDVPYAIRFDATASVNRPGWGGAWQRAVERRALREARLLVPVSRGAREGLPDLGPTTPPVVRVPIPVEEIAAAATRDIDAVAYAGYPRKRGLELLCQAWPGSGTLVIGGLDRDKGLAWLDRCGVEEPAGVEWAGALPRDEWLSLVGRARVYVNASRWEDFGLGPLEALSAGTPLVTVPTPGSFEALPLAQQLAPDLVAAEVSADALAAALQAGLGLGKGEREDYAARARVLLEPYREERVLELVRSSVLPALGVAP
jgi:glycosyltransferase involved in cell wall biosynthesis